MTVTLPLSKKAQEKPMMAWKQALASLTGHVPLMVSLINPGRGEVWYDSKAAPEVSSVLSREGYLVENVVVTEKDLGRRMQAYLAGYFLLLRREALTGFSPDLQLKILDLAATNLKAKFPDRLTQQQWKHQIAKDRLWIQDEMEVV
jgi:hypothetical protein